MGQSNLGSNKGLRKRNGLQGSSESIKDRLRTCLSMEGLSAVRNPGIDNQNVLFIFRTGGPSMGIWFTAGLENSLNFKRMNGWIKE